MKIPDPWEGYPTEWSKYDGKHMKYMLPPELPRPTETYRFGARYRAAKMYRGAKLEGYSDPATAQGYSALLGFVLAFSAFEYFYKEVLSQNVPGILKQLRRDHIKEMTTFQNEFEFLVKSPDTNLLFRKIYPHVHKIYQKSIDEMLAGKDANLIRVFAAIRHAFIHGHLTPNMGKVEPITVIELCRFGYRFFMEMMDKQFSARLNWVMPPPSY